MQLEYQLTFRDFSAAQALHSKRNLLGRAMRFAGFYVIPVLGALMWILVFSVAIQSDWRNFNWITLVVGAIWMAIPVYRRWAMLRLYRRTVTRSGNSVLDLSAELIRCESPHSKGEIKWEGIQRFAEDTKSFLLYLAPGKFLVIPKRVCSPEQVEKLRSLFQSEIKPLPFK